MILKDLIDKYKWLLEVPVGLFKCITWENEWLEQNKEDYIFVDGEYLVGAFLEAIKQPKTIVFNHKDVTFVANRRTLTITDDFNDMVDKIPVKNKIEVFKAVVYYCDERLMDYDEYRKTFIVSKKEYEKYKNFIDKLDTIVV